MGVWVSRTMLASFYLNKMIPWANRIFDLPRGSFPRSIGEVYSPSLTARYSGCSLSFSISWAERGSTSYHLPPGCHEYSSGAAAPFAELPSLLSNRIIPRPALLPLLQVQYLSSQLIPSKSPSLSCFCASERHSSTRIVLTRVVLPRL